MTAWDLFAKVRRNLVVFIAGVALTLVWAAVLYRTPGVYSSRVAVVLQLPVNPRTPNSLQFTSDGQIALAGIVSKEIAGPTQGAKITSPSMTLADEGIYDGESVNLPDTGGQWASNFTTPELDLQVTGPTAEDVQQRMQALVKDTEAKVVQIQEDLHVAKNQIIDSRMDPGTIPIYFQDGNKKRSVVAALVAGIWMSLVAVIVSDAFRRRRSRALAEATGRSEQAVMA